MDREPVSEGSFPAESFCTALAKGYTRDKFIPASDDERI